MTLEKQCQDHWRKLRIQDEDLLKNYIKEIFKRAETQSEALIEIYKLVIPDWDNTRKLRNYPESGNELWKFICRQFMDFDRNHHPNCFAGGIWLNNGYSSNAELDPWELRFNNCEPEY